MKYLNDLYKYNKKVIYICLIVFLVLIIGFVIFNSSKNSNQDKDNLTKIEILKLFGDREITIAEGTNYVEPGYYAVDSNGQIRTDDVIVTPKNFSSSEPGVYYIHYTIDNKEEERKIIVEKKEVHDTLNLELLGSEMLILELGEEFKEPGFVASSTLEGDLSKFVKVIGSVDTNKAGTYILTYELTNSKSEVITKKRTIIVSDSKLEVIINKSTSNYTNQNVVISLEVKGNNFSYIKYPNGLVSKEKISTYVVDKNGTYNFLIYDKNNNYMSKEVTVNEIDKTLPTGTCNAIISNGKSTINVSATDNTEIEKYEYYGNDVLLNLTFSSTYTISKTYSNYKVTIFDKAGNSNTVNCNIKSNESEPLKYNYLEMHMFVSGHYDDAILIRTSQATIFIDGGRSRCYKYIEPYLNKLGVKTIDAIIGSHTDSDHIEAEADIIKNFNVLSAYYPVDLTTCASKGYCDSASDVKAVVTASKNKNLPLSVKKAGETLQIGDMTLYFIGPATLKNSGSHRGNSNSFIFILNYKNTTLLFPGDADSGVFNVTKNKPFADKLGISLKVDVLKYPHHGNASINDAMLKAMSPKYVLIPNYNASKYPSSSNEQKLKNIGATVYENAKDGNIVLISDGNNITIKKNQQPSDYKR